MRRSAWHLLLLLAPALAWAQVSPFNGLLIPEVDSTGSYRLLIGGHFHGSSANRSGFPAASLLANLDTINGLGAHVLLSTGDLYLNADADAGRYQRTLFARLRMPLFNAPGNHDVEGSYYLRHYAPTHTLLTLGRDRVLMLDTERDNGSIRGEQLDLLKAQVEEQEGRLFIVSHRPIWAEEDAVYSPLFKGNTRSILPTNFKRDVLPLLEAIAAKRPVYWIAGSMAGRAPASIFHQPHAPNITYIQCALRDEPRDAMLIAELSPDTVRWSALSLTGRPMQGVETYDAAWWAANMTLPPAFNWRLLPYEIKLVVTHRAFWWGLGAGLLLMMLYRLVRSRLF